MNSERKQTREASNKRRLIHQDVLDDAQAIVNDPISPIAIPVKDTGKRKIGFANEEPAIISGPALRLLLAEIDPSATMQDDLLEALQHEASAFVDSALSNGAQITARRKDSAGTMSSQDVAIYLRVNRGIIFGKQPYWKRPKRNITD